MTNIANLENVIVSEGSIIFQQQPISKIKIIFGIFICRPVCIYLHGNILHLIVS